jgi:hypothetical protein
VISFKARSIAVGLSNEKPEKSPLKGRGQLYLSPTSAKNPHSGSSSRKSPGKSKSISKSQSMKPEDPYSKDKKDEIDELKSRTSPIKPKKFEGSGGSQLHKSPTESRRKKQL